MPQPTGYPSPFSFELHDIESGGFGFTSSPNGSHTLEWVDGDDQYEELPAVFVSMRQISGLSWKLAITDDQFTSVEFDVTWASDLQSWSAPALADYIVGGGWTAPVTVTPIEVTTIYEVAEALKDALAAVTAGTFSREFTPERVYEFPIEIATGDVDELRVLVAARPDSRETVSRDSVERDVLIDICVLEKIEDDPTTEAANAEIDPLATFVQQLVEWPRTIRASSGAVLTCAGAKFVKSIIDAAYDRATLRTARVFQSIITYTFKLQS